MLLKNLEVENGLVNGARGVIVDFIEEPDLSLTIVNDKNLVPVVEFIVTMGREKCRIQKMVHVEMFTIEQGSK
jgi:hypothetical protein